MNDMTDMVLLKLRRAGDQLSRSERGFHAMRGLLAWLEESAFRSIASIRLQSSRCCTGREADTPGRRVI